MEYPSINTVVETVSRKFHNMEDFIRAMYYAIVLEKNAVFYGKGGHAKSECSMEVLRAMGILMEDVFVKAMSVSTSDSEILGGINMKTFKEKGYIRYNVSKSMFNKKIAILEEGFDARPSALMAMKAPLTSKVVQNGGQMFDIKTKSVIVLTNRDKSYLDKDDAVKALAERFHFWHRTEWKMEDYQNRNVWLSMLNKTNPQLNTPDKDMLIGIVIDMHSNSEWVSPRTVKNAADILQAQGIEPLKYIEEFSNKIDEMLEVKKREETIRKTRVVIETYREKQNTLGKAYDKASTPIEYNKVAVLAQNLFDEGAQISVNDDLFEELDSIRKVFLNLKKNAIDASLNSTRV